MKRFIRSLQETDLHLEPWAFLALCTALLISSIVISDYVYKQTTVKALLDNQETRAKVLVNDVAVGTTPYQGWLMHGDKVTVFSPSLETTETLFHNYVIEAPDRGKLLVIPFETVPPEQLEAMEQELLEQ